MTTGILVCGHGSRSQAAVDEFAAVARRLRERFPGTPVAHGYLEFANPVLREGLDRLRSEGCDHILAVPGMLFAAMHAKNDIPTVLNTYGAAHGVKVEYGRVLGVDPRLIRAASERIADAMSEADQRYGPVPLEDTCLVVVGRGASDPDANGNVAKVARMLQEGMGFGWLETCYSGVTFPLVEPCLTHAARLGYPRILVFPWFLFTGVLIDRIYGFAREAAARHPEIQVQTAGYLNDHPGVIDTFVERIEEIGRGENLMNCTMCKYRAQILGFEAEVGMAQESHHHHVEGQGAHAPGTRVEDCPDCDDFCTGACRLRLADSAGAHAHDRGGHSDERDALPGNGAKAHERRPHSHGEHRHEHHHHHHHQNGHHHPPYPHARHPHGPESVRARLKDPTPEVDSTNRTASLELADFGAPPALPCETDPARIYAQSYERIAQSCEMSAMPADLRPVVMRMVHAVGIPDLVEDVVSSKDAMQAATQALARNAPVFCDSEMTRAGFLARHRERYRPEVLLHRAEATRLADAWSTTRSAAAVELWRPRVEDAFVVVGNAPTALFHLLARLEEGWPRPAFVLATPVGFVGAEESKRKLAELPLAVPYLTVLGRRGGSAVAAAAFNALAEAVAQQGARQ